MGTAKDGGTEETLTVIPDGSSRLDLRPTTEDLLFHLMDKNNGENPLPDVIQEIDATELFAKPPRSLVSFPSGEREWYFFVRITGDADVHNAFTYGGVPIKMVGDRVGYWKVDGRPDHFDVDGETVLWFRCTYFSGRGVQSRKTHWRMEAIRMGVNFLARRKELREEWMLMKLQRGTDYYSI